MSNLQLKQPIQFLLEQLKNNDQNWSNFLNLWFLKNYPEQYLMEKISEGTVSNQLFNENHIIELFIRTCLSRTKETEDENGDAIISVFEGDSAFYLSNGGIDGYNKISDVLGEEFDLLIRHSYSLDEAIDSLGERMVDLVPEYEEWRQNNLK